MNKKEEIEFYRNLTPQQVEFYKSMVATRMQVLLVRCCIVIMFILLGFGITFLFRGDTVSGGVCLGADTLFGWIAHRVYSHFFPEK